MIRVSSATALLLVTMGTEASAQSFKGAEISGEILTFSEGEDFTANNYRGSLEFGVVGPFGVQADLSFYDLEDAETVRNTTLHLTYDALEFATVGAFYARDSVDGSDASLWGAEAGRSLGPAGGEVYVGFGDNEGADFRAFGFDGAVDLGGRFSLTASAASIHFDEGNINRLSAGAEWRWGDNGPAIYAEVGRLNATADGLGTASADFIGLGGRIAIGPNRGTTFESRGLFEVLGSF